MEELKNKHYDFIEIGTSDFRTLIEICKDDEVGLSIEPIQTYLDNLPNKKNVKKLCCAISDRDGFVDMFYVKPNVIEKNNLHEDVRGCNSIIKPHLSIKKLLGDKHDEFVTVEKVKTLTWNTLIEMYEIDSINFLKIDTEGHDAIILNELYKIAINKVSLFPRKILFENNILSDKELTRQVISNFEKYGYKGKQIGRDYELIRTNNKQ